MLAIAGSALLGFLLARRGSVVSLLAAVPVVVSAAIVAEGAAGADGLAVFGFGAGAAVATQAAYFLGALLWPQIEAVGITDVRPTPHQ
jgi:hypothetical protein